MNLTITPFTHANETGYTFSGAINETSDLSALAQSMMALPTKKLVFQLAGVTRINSIGGKKWMMFLDQLIKGGFEITLDQLPFVFVEQLNIVRNFAQTAQIRTFHIPFLCRTCNQTLIGNVNKNDFVKGGCKIPQVTCPKCKGPTEFDEIEDEYFAFLKR